MTDFNSVDILMLSENYNFPFLKQICIDYISIWYEQVNQIKNLDSFFQMLDEDFKFELKQSLYQAK